MVGAEPSREDMLHDPRWLVVRLFNEKRIIADAVYGSGMRLGLGRGRAGRLRINQVRTAGCEPSGVRKNTDYAAVHYEQVRREFEPVNIKFW